MEIVGVIKQGDELSKFKADLRKKKLLRLHLKINDESELTARFLVWVQNVAFPLSELCRQCQLCGGFGFVFLQKHGV